MPATLFDFSKSREGFDGNQLKKKSHSAEKTAVMRIHSQI